VIPFIKLIVCVQCFEIRLLAWVYYGIPNGRHYVTEDGQWPSHKRLYDPQMNSAFGLAGSHHSNGDAFLLVK
jgi:hypothetical protein